MTDNEIIKALEHCKNQGFVSKCCECRYKNASGCVEYLITDALDLINHQKAEIENQSENFKRLVAEHRKLQTDYSSMQSTLAKMSMGVEQAKAEAIKEFAERLKTEKTTAISCHTFEEVVRKSDINNLVKEMVGDTE